MIAIYKNESFLIEDKVKEYFKKAYKHVDLTISYEEINDLITGYYITLKENKLMIQSSSYISIEEFESYKDVIDTIMDAIDMELYSMLYRYYRTI